MKTKEKYKIVKEYNRETGELLSEQIKRIVTEKEKAIINNKDELRRMNKVLGGFLRVMYVENELLFNKIGLD